MGVWRLLELLERLLDAAAAAGWETAGGRWTVLRLIPVMAMAMSDDSRHDNIDGHDVGGCIGVGYYAYGVSCEEQRHERAGCHCRHERDASSMLAGCCCHENLRRCLKFNVRDADPMTCRSSTIHPLVT